MSMSEMSLALSFALQCKGEEECKALLYTLAILSETLNIAFAFTCSCEEEEG